MKTPPLVRDEAPAKWPPGGCPKNKNYLNFHTGNKQTGNTHGSTMLDSWSFYFFKISNLNLQITNKSQ
jgi:hypothetical protein